MKKILFCACVSILLSTHLVAKESVKEGDGLRFSNSISSEKIYRWRQEQMMSYGDVRPIYDLDSRSLVIMNLPLSASERLKREPISDEEARRVLGVNHHHKHNI